MRFTGVPAATLRVDDRGLADRQPVLGDAGLRRRAGPRQQAWTRRGCRRWSRRVRSSGRCCPRWPTELGIPATGRGRHRPARPALGRRRRRRGRARAAARLDRHHGLDQRAGAAQEDRRAAAAGRACRASTTRRTCWPTTRTPPAATSSGGATRSPPTSSYDELLAEAAATPPGAGGVVFTPWLTGERSPVDDRNARAGFHGDRRDHHARRPDPRGARGRRAQRDLAARRGREVRRRRASTTSGSSAGEPGRTCGARCWPTSPTGPSCASPTRGWPGCAAPPCSRRWRWAGSTRSEVRGLVPTDEPFRPDPRHRATYDALARELPKLYAAQRGFFRRRGRPGRR